MTDRWRGVFVAGTFGVALVLLLHVATGCGDGGKKACDEHALGNRCHDAAVADDAGPALDAMIVDSGGGADAPGTDAGGLSDAAPPPDASSPDAATAD